jgi:hypothetical protein
MDTSLKGINNRIDSMEQFKDKGSFLGTWKTADGRIAIVIAKSKHVIAATRREEVIWVGFLLTSVTSHIGPIPMIWREDGKSFYNYNNEDLVESVRVKA